MSDRYIPTEALNARQDQKLPPPLPVGQNSPDRWVEIGSEWVACNGSWN